jgi:UDP-N-acetylglucosamine 1-carboxyvinyltransferase
MKNTLIIHGGKPLRGTITLQGAKNEALQILSAVLLYPGKTKVENVPDILDVRELMEILKLLGVAIEEDWKNSSHVFDASNVDPDQMKTPEFRELSSRLRGSLMVAGAMLGRFGVAYMPTPGGDKIGIRPVTTHLKAFSDIGAVIDQEGDYYEITLKTVVPKSSRITLREASVTGTANILLASCLSFGEEARPFEIYNAACEPYIQKLCQLLSLYGAHISGIGSNLLRIEPRKVRSDKTRIGHKISPDMLELGNFITLAAVCGNGINIGCENPKSVLGEIAGHVFQRLGVQCYFHDSYCFVPYHESFEIQRPTTPGKTVRSIYDNVWPGLSPDHISSMVALAVHAKGTLVVEQRMFDERLLFVSTLRSMGAEIVSATNKMVTVVGNNKQTKLRGLEMSSPDIRAGMALLIAALAAEGKSIIHNVSQIHRGYENIVERLRDLGAEIEERD